MITNSGLNPLAVVPIPTFSHWSQLRCIIYHWAPRYSRLTRNITRKAEPRTETLLEAALRGGRFQDPRRGSYRQSLDHPHLRTRSVTLTMNTYSLTTKYRPKSVAVWDDPELESPESPRGDRIARRKRPTVGGQPQGCGRKRR
jgi:hypothetical protein